MELKCRDGARPVSTMGCTDYKSARAGWRGRENHRSCGFVTRTSHQGCYTDCKGGCLKSIFNH